MKSTSYGLLVSVCLLSGCVTAPNTRGAKTWHLYVLEVPVAEVQVEDESLGNMVDVSLREDTAAVTLRPRGSATLKPLPGARIPGLQLAFYKEDLRWERSKAPRLTGAQIAPLLAQGRYEEIERALDGVGWSLKDDVSRELLEAAPEAAVKALESERGRRLLDRLYDELMSAEPGAPGPDELRLADEVLALKAQRISPEAFIGALLDLTTKVFPIRKGGITVPSSAPLDAWRGTDGAIHVRYFSRVAQFDGAQALRGQGGEERLPEDEVVCAKLHDLGGRVRCGPALMLLQYAHEDTAHMLREWANLALLGTGIGSGALVGKGAGAAGALVWFDRAAVALGMLSIVVNDHRGWILEKFGVRGEQFLLYADIVECAVGLYGLARMATAVPRLFGWLGTEHQNLRQAARAAEEALDSEQRAVLRIIDEQMTELLGDVEGLRNAGGAKVIPIERGQLFRPKKPAAPAEQPVPAIKEEPLRATGTGGRLVPIGDGRSGPPRAMASSGGGGPKEPVTPAPPTSQGARSSSGGRAPWRSAPLSRAEAEVAAELVRRKIPELNARKTAQLAADNGLLDRVEELVKSRGYMNPEDLHSFLKRWKRNEEGKIQALDDAIARLRKGHEIALENGWADLVDFTTREAIQHKRIFSNDPRTLTADLEKAAQQLRGGTGEKPPDDFEWVIDVRFDPQSQNPMRKADRNMLRRLFPPREALEKVDLVRITTNNGSLEFEPPFPLF